MTDNSTPAWPRGSIIRISSFAFDPATSASLKDGFKPKFFVLMERWDNGRDDVLIAFTTSKVDKNANRKDCVMVKKGTVSALPLDSLIRGDNLQLLHKASQVTKCTLVGEMPSHILTQVVDSLHYARRLDIGLVLRARGIPDFPK